MISVSDRVKKPDPADLARKLTREELESLVLERLADEDQSLANAIVVRFAKSDAGGAREIVHSLVEGRTGNRYGMINDAEGLSYELEELRNRVKAWKSPGEDLEAFALLRAIVDKVAPVCWEGDDHDGVLVGSVQETLDDIRSLASRPDADPECLREIRVWALGHVEARWALEGDSWDYMLIIIQLAASRGKEERRESLELCRSKCAPEPGNWNTDYLAERCAKAILDALGAPADDAERRVFIAGHLLLDTVRDEAINLALGDKDCEAAERLAREGMALAERKGRSGTADGFATRLLEAFNAKGDATAALAFLEARVIEKKAMDWFEKLKRRVPKDGEWEVVRERIIASLPTKSGYFQAAIFAAEGLVERLRDLASHDESVMRDHYRQIGHSFPDDAARYLEKGIRKELERTHSRNGYERIATEVREYGGYAGRSAMIKLFDDLLSRYSNRPAMIAELSKAVGKAKAP